MEDNFQINLSDFSIGPDELDWLPKEWQKDPKPKTINEIARMVLLHHWELQTNFLPFDIRRSYKEKDRIIVRTVEEWIEPAEVVSVAKNAYKDTGDIINVRLLSYHAKLYGKDIKSFVANYQGEDINVSIVKFNIISEKDETDVIPKLLMAIMDDKRFVNFGEYWLPLDWLVSDVSKKIGDVRKIITKSKRPVSTRDILEELYANDNKEKLNERLEFSINYFLEQDRRLIRISEEVTKWDLRKPSGPVLLAIDTKDLLNDKLRTFSDLDLLLFYHGFIGQCVFTFPNDRKVNAYHDISEGSISGDEFVGELAKLSQNKKHEVEFVSPELRGGPIEVCIPVPALPEKRHWTVTIRPEWLEKGVLLVPQKLSNCIKKRDIMHVLYDQVDELLPYSHNDRLIKRLANYYTTKAIAECDKVHLRLQSLEPARLFLSCRWQKRLDRLLQIKPTDLNWKRISLRDCIIIVLSKFRKPAHYRDIYSEIAFHKQVTLGSIIATLSRYSPSLFVHAGYCQWQLAGWICPNEHLGQEPAAEGPKIPEISDKIWKAVAVIEDNDYVYKLLQKAAGPLSFDEICSRLADYLKVDVNQLRATGFLMPDKRFRRLDNGTWALEEWFGKQESAGPVQIEPPKPEKSSWAGKLWLVLTDIVGSVKRYYSRFFNLIFRQQILRK